MFTDTDRDYHFGKRYFQWVKKIMVVIYDILNIVKKCLPTESPGRKYAHITAFY